MARRHVLLLLGAVGLLAAFLPLANAASTSENQGRIAFSSNRDDPNYDLYAVDPDGNNLARLTDDPGFDADPAWSPDSRTIAFDSTRDGGDANIFLMNPDGTNVRQLTSSAGDNFQPKWSPDGHWIAFTSRRTGHGEVFVMRADGSAQTQVTHTPDPEVNHRPAFLDGGKLVYGHAPDSTFEGPISLMTIHKDGHAPAVLPTDGAGNPDEPSMSSGAGHQLVFVNNFCSVCSFSDVFTLRAGGTRVRQLTADFGNNLDPAWSPHGRAIAFTHEDEPVTFTHEEIYTMDADGSHRYNVTHDGPDGPDDFGPSWGCPGTGTCSR